MKPKQGDKVRFKNDTGVVLDFYKNHKGPYYTLNFKGKKYSHSWTVIKEEELKEIELV